MTDKPNILVIWGDDIGITNLSCYSDGLMGYKTPNIDRIADEGIRFTDYYGEQSCTAGRSSFILGQSPLRSGLSKVGMPGAKIGISPEDPTIARALKQEGYRTGQFGKNHLGDRDEFIPSNHGFDEFWGCLYHLPANELLESPDYPHELAKQSGLKPRGIVHGTADGGVEDVGDLTTKRLVDFDDEVISRSADFIRDAHEADEPFFVWTNTTHMHYFTVAKPDQAGQAGPNQSPYHDVMVDHDRLVGSLLDLLDELDIADNTIVMYSTDNGPHENAWPDAATTPFRSEKDSNWEGAFRVPCVVRWPGKIEPGTVSNEIMSHNDWFPTLLAAAGRDTIVEDLKAGAELDGHHYWVHLDGFDFTDHLTGQSESGPREQFFYISDDGDILGLRWQNFKIVFMEQRAEGTLMIWLNPFTHLRAPKLFNLRTDPYERADKHSNQYWEWLLAHEFVVEFGQLAAHQALETFREFPPRQRPATFGLGDALEKVIEEGPSNKVEAAFHGVIGKLSAGIGSK